MPRPLALGFVAGTALVFLLAASFVAGVARRRPRPCTSSEPSRQLLAPELDKRVVAQVSLTAREARSWDAGQVASVIAAVVGTTPDRVKVLDESLEPLFDGGKAVPSGRSTLPAARPTQLHP